MKDKRTKNFHREVVKKNDFLNKLVVLDDVPFFWDNWDIMHHTFETKQTLVQDNLTNFEVLECTDHKVRLGFEFKISDKSKIS